jgi:hypothetical protein
MKRGTMQRRLHMGCGEDLTGRAPLRQWPAAKAPAERAPRAAHPKAGKGGR